MVEKDYIDITPTGVMDGKGKKGLKQTVFQVNDLKIIRENPGRLTKEGLDEKIRIWDKSANTHVQLFYKTMKVQCKAMAASGKTKDGAVIWSRNEDGSARWKSVPPKPIKTKGE